MNDDYKKNKDKIIDIKKIKNSWSVVINDKGEKHMFIIKMTIKKGKKYDVYTIEKTDDNKYKLKYRFSFGSSAYQHFKDALGGYSELDHGDPKRRHLYFLRHKHTDNINSPKFFSNYLLW